MFITNYLYKFYSQGKILDTKSIEAVLGTATAQAGQNNKMSPRSPAKRGSELHRAVFRPLCGRNVSFSASLTQPRSDHRPQRLFDARAKNLTLNMNPIEKLLIPSLGGMNKQ